MAREKLFISKKTSKESNDLRVGDLMLFTLIKTPSYDDRSSRQVARLHELAFD